MVVSGPRLFTVPLATNSRDVHSTAVFAGVEYAVSRAGRCLIGDEMGLGKTLQAIAVAAYYQWAS